MAKRAFLVGINNYANPDFALRGCTHDVDSLRAVLIDLYGFLNEDIKICNDATATRASILGSLEDLLNGASNGDQLVFGYSGHATRIVTSDISGHPDGKIDAIVPFEASFASLITSAELFRAITAKIVAPTIGFTAIYDCCHSGNLIRDIVSDSSGNLIVAVKNRFIDIPLPVDLPLNKDIEIGPYNEFSACLDSETAADLLNVPGEKNPRGAFSYALHTIMRQQGAKIKISDLDRLTLPLIKKVSPNHAQTPVFHAVDKDGNVFG